VDSLPVPKTVLELERGLAAVAGSDTARVAYLSKHLSGKGKVKALVQSSLSGPVLVSLARGASGLARGGNVEAAVALMREVSELPRFDMVKMLLGKGEKQELGEMVATLKDSGGDVHGWGDKMR
jgi:hypothetical protein